MTRKGAHHAGLVKWNCVVDEASFILKTVRWGSRWLDGWFHLKRWLKKVPAVRFQSNLCRILNSPPEVLWMCITFILVGIEIYVGYILYPKSFDWISLFQMRLFELLDHLGGCLPFASCGHFWFDHLGQGISVPRYGGWVMGCKKWLLLFF